MLHNDYCTPGLHNHSLCNFELNMIYARQWIKNKLTALPDVNAVIMYGDDAANFRPLCTFSAWHVGNEQGCIFSECRAGGGLMELVLWSYLKWPFSYWDYLVVKIFFLAFFRVRELMADATSNSWNTGVSGVLCVTDKASFIHFIQFKTPQLALLTKIVRLPYSAAAAFMGINAVDTLCWRNWCAYFQSFQSQY